MSPSEQNLLELAASLNGSADSLRGCDADGRKAAATPELLGSITDALKHSDTLRDNFNLSGKSKDELQEKERVHCRERLITGAARVVANLIVDNDENRQKVCAAGYLEGVKPTIREYEARLGMPAATRGSGLTMDSLRAVLASLLNLSLGSVVPIKTYITSNLLFSLINVANLLYLPLQETSSAEDAEKRRGMCDWIWKISDECLAVENALDSVDTAIIAACAVPLVALTRPAVGLDDLETDEDAEEVLEMEVHVLEASLRFFDLVTTSKPQWLPNLLEITPLLPSSLPTSPIGSKTAMTILLDFLEHATVSPIWSTFWTTDDDDAEAGADQGAEPATAEKMMGQAKAIIMKAVVETPAEVDMTIEGKGYKEFWKRMKGWIRMGTVEAESGGAERADLVSCGLLCYGNQARSEFVIRNLSRDPEFLSLLHAHLKSFHPSTDKQITHALIGLLRNLLIPDILKEDLGPAAIDALGRLDLNQSTLVGPTVGGAVVLLKHVAKGNLTNSLLATRPHSFNQGLLHSLLLLSTSPTSNDIPLKSESARVIVNILKSLWSTSTKGQQDENHDQAREGQVMEAKARMSDERVVEALVGLVRGESGVLVGEGVMGLVLVARQDEGLKIVFNICIKPANLNRILSLLSPSSAPPSNADPISISNDIIELPSPSNSQPSQTPPTPPLPIEIKSNIALLLFSLGTAAHDPSRSRPEPEELGGIEEKVKGLLRGVLDKEGEEGGKSGNEGYTEMVRRALEAWGI